MKQLIEFSYNGQEALKTVIEESSYRTLEQAIACLTMFAHPDVVHATNTRHLFCVVRTQNNAARGQIVDLGGGVRALQDDNLTPTNAFIWAHGIRRSQYKDIQFNHVWGQSANITAYTNLANIFLLPSFLSKLTDTHPEVKALLRYRCYELFQYHPEGTIVPEMPRAYNELQWAAPHPCVSNLEVCLRRAMTSSPRSRTTISAREIGWYFSGYEPDTEI
ncbi:MAG: hypothetical protein NT010_16060 [Proteobacteria bacterium]|nr:hypothetical protein [Pseudomonadota bacterium]